MVYFVHKFRAQAILKYQELYFIIPNFLEKINNSKLTLFDIRFYSFTTRHLFFPYPPTSVFSCISVSVGAVSVGTVSVGTVSFWVVSVGAVSVGTVSFWVVSLGAVSVLVVIRVTYINSRVFRFIINLDQECFQLFIQNLINIR